MTHYSNESNRVRIDLFKPSGNWLGTEDILWFSTPETTWEHPALMWNEFKISVRRKLGDRCIGMTIVCLEPYHPDAHPLLWVYTYSDT